ncbi:Non-specific DNA-binding protein Dps / Iron-binding ferritin-like antioxidant protein / Ferroxidase [Rhodopirellula islandica]|uniref:Non-specific DNA-binding protein Dps / Iron-binding ferritin-like antioxidant protein / Ferroxidase n=1 Tax=Rhodopirellula islandica TaxID=595434 RepID=A0A0J1BHM5_RHOIS|nr:DNA starvation/stationary phase protection protein Dps [Rhodopirellula islandica]KLU05998.1 Non-specific DNA-binding protein Dps / Iron-binding ferritin-like antioxidant protein / Ferroxidase [Rhodopirellula islandica]
MSTTTTTKTPFKREILEDETNQEVTSLLQHNLTDLIDLALLMKQAHWNVVGQNFRSIHLQLDEIIETVRAGSDEVAERIVTLGGPADGRSSTVVAESELEEYPGGFVKVSETIAKVADALKQMIDSLRSAIEKLGELDAISEDMLIALSGELEKHLWMLQAQEV